MDTIVEGGIVASRANAKNKAVVLTINFGTVVRVNGRIPVGIEGDMIIKQVPDVSNFVAKEVLNYSDSNNNNATTLNVISVTGPTKYKVKVA